MEGHPCSFGAGLDRPPRSGVRARRGSDGAAESPRRQRGGDFGPGDATQAAGRADADRRSAPIRAQRLDAQVFVVEAEVVLESLEEAVDLLGSRVDDAFGAEAPRPGSAAWLEISIDN